MLVEMEESCIFLCHAAYYAAKIGNRQDDEYIKKYLPELYKQKPIDVLKNEVWWDLFEREERINALKQAIKLTHP